MSWVAVGVAAVGVITSLKAGRDRKAAADFEAEVKAIARALAAGPTLGYVRTREAIDKAATSTLDSQLDFEVALQRELGNSQDYAEGVRAFIAKRPPVFVGK